MKSITQDTALSAFGMTPELILSGEKCEFDPEAKVNARKDKYVKHDFAMRICDAYAEDLLAAYRAIEELERENEQLHAELNETAKTAETSTNQVRQMLKGEKEFEDAEKLLAKFEAQLETLAKDKRADKNTIQQLTAQVEKLKELQETVPQLEHDVNEVLANLRQYFEEEGVPLMDEDEDDYADYEDDYEG